MVEDIAHSAEPGMSAFESGSHRDREQYVMSCHGRRMEFKDRGCLMIDICTHLRSGMQPARHCVPLD